MMGRIVYYKLTLFETTQTDDPNEVMQDLKERAAKITGFCKEQGFGVSSFNIVAGGSTEQEPEGEQA
jgi:hypothetical protein